MAQQQNYNELIETIKAIPPEEVQAPDIPADVFAQEAENLAKWAAMDKGALKGAGLGWALVEALPARAGALRQAESLYPERAAATAEVRVGQLREVASAGVTMCPVCLVNLRKAANGSMQFQDVSHYLRRVYGD